MLANQLLVRRLTVRGYNQTKFTTGLWEHVSSPIKFTLVVDDFVVQYMGVNMPFTSLMLWHNPTSCLKIDQAVYTVVLY
jgi:hypothetical protein